MEKIIISKFYELDKWIKFDEIIMKYSISSDHDFSDIDLFFVANAYHSVGNFEEYKRVFEKISDDSLKTYFEIRHLMFEKKYDTALSKTMGLITSDTLPYRFLVGRIHLQLARIYYFINNLEESLKSYKRALEILEQEQEKFAKWMTMMGLSSIYHRLGDYSHQETILNLLEKDISDLPYQIIHATVDSAKGWNHVPLGEYKKAIKYLERAANYHKTAPNTDEKIRVLIQYLDLLLPFGDIVKADEVATKLKGISLTQTPNYFRKNELSVMYAKVNFYKGNFENAIKTIETTIEQNNKTIDRQYAVLELLELFLCSGNVDSANKIFEKFKSEFEGENSYNLDYYKAWILVEKGKIAEAKIVAIAMEERAKKQNLQLDVTRSSLVLAMIAIREENFVLAKEYLTREWNSDFFSESIIGLGLIIRYLKDDKLALKLLYCFTSDQKRKNPFIEIFERYFKGLPVFQVQDEGFNNFIKVTLGIEPWVVKTNQGTVYSLDFKSNSEKGYDLVIDGANKKVLSKTKEIEIDTDSIVYKILMLFTARDVREISKSDLYLKIWGDQFVSMEDNSKIHSAIKRLNKLFSKDFLEISLNGIIKRKSDFGFQYYGPGRNKQRLNQRENNIVEHLQKEKTVSGKRLAQLLGVSTRTIQRDLKNLLSSGRVMVNPSQRGSYQQVFND